MSSESKDQNTENPEQYVDVVYQLDNIFSVHLTDNNNTDLTNSTFLAVNDLSSSDQSKIFVNIACDGSNYHSMPTLFLNNENLVDSYGTITQQLMHYNNEPSVPQPVSNDDISEFLVFHEKKRSPTDDPKLNLRCTVKLQKLPCEIPKNEKPNSEKPLKDDKMVTKRKLAAIQSKAKKFKRRESILLCNHLPEYSNRRQPVRAVRSKGGEERPKIVLKIVKDKENSYRCYNPLADIKNRFELKECNVAIERLRTSNFSKTPHPDEANTCIEEYTTPYQDLPLDLSMPKTLKDIVPLVVKEQTGMTEFKNAERTSLDIDSSINAVPSVSMKNESQIIPIVEPKDGYIIPCSNNEDCSADVDGFIIPSSKNEDRSADVDGFIIPSSNNENRSANVNGLIIPSSNNEDRSADSDNDSIASDASDTLSLYAPSLSDISNSPKTNQCRYTKNNQQGIEKFRIPKLKKTGSLAEPMKLLKGATVESQVEEILALTIRSTPSKMLSPIKDLDLTSIRSKSSAGFKQNKQNGHTSKSSESVHSTKRPKSAKVTSAKDTTGKSTSPKSTLTKSTSAKSTLTKSKSAKSTSTKAVLAKATSVKATSPTKPSKTREIYKIKENSAKGETKKSSVLPKTSKSDEIPRTEKSSTKAKISVHSSSKKSSDRINGTEKNVDLSQSTIDLKSGVVKFTGQNSHRNLSLTRGITTSMETDSTTALSAVPTPVVAEALPSLLTRRHSLNYEPRLNVNLSQRNQRRGSIIRDNEKIIRDARSLIRKPRLNVNSSQPNQQLGSINPDKEKRYRDAANSLFRKPCINFLSRKPCSKECKASHQLPNVELIFIEMQNFDVEKIQFIYEKFILESSVTFCEYFPTICRLYGLRKLKQNLYAMVADCEKYERCDFFGDIVNALVLCGESERSAFIVIIERCKACRASIGAIFELLKENQDEELRTDIFKIILVKMPELQTFL